MEIHGYENNDSKQNHQGVEVTPAKSLKVALTENTPSNPLPIQDIDGSGRSGVNTLFGDRVMATRKIMIAAQFQYGIETGTSTPEIINGAAIDFDENILKINTGTNATGKATIETVETVRYIPGTEVFAKFTAFFENSQPNSFLRAGLFDVNNGFYIEVVNNEMYFCRRRSEVDFRELIDIAAFNAREGYELDISKGNIYKISFVYLGFGPILLEVERPDGRLVLLHRIEYPNKHTQSHITQTYLTMRAEAVNTGSVVNSGIGVGSIAAGIINGSSEDVARRTFSYENDVSFIINTNTTLVAFRNKSTFNGIVNRIVARLVLISGSNELNKNARWRILKNPTFLNTPTWNDVNTLDSVLEYSTDALVDFAAPSAKFLAWNVSKIESFFEMVKQLELDMPPNGVAAFVISTAGTGEADLSIRWNELF